MWICHECGEKHGKRRCELSTWHYGTCNWCGEHKPVTESRDYGYPEHIREVTKKVERSSEMNKEKLSFVEEEERHQELLSLILQMEIKLGGADEYEGPTLEPDRFPGI